MPLFHAHFVLVLLLSSFIYFLFIANAQALWVWIVRLFFLIPVISSFLEVLSENIFCLLCFIPLLGSN